MGNMSHFLLTADAIINIILGIVLLLMPIGLDQLLGLPIPVHYFYPTILGAVLLGIGIALLLERYNGHRNVRGLGLNGAIVINFCGVCVLIFWLVFTNLNIPLRGLILIWVIAILVLITGVFELFVKSSKQ